MPKQKQMDGYYTSFEVARKLQLGSRNEGKIMRKLGVEPERISGTNYWHVEASDTAIKNYLESRNGGDRKNKRGFYETSYVAAELGVHGSMVPRIMEKYGCARNRVGIRNLYPTRDADAAIERYLESKGRPRKAAAPEKPQGSQANAPALPDYELIMLEDGDRLVIGVRLPEDVSGVVESMEMRLKDKNPGAHARAILKAACETGVAAPYLVELLGDGAGKKK